MTAEYSVHTLELMLPEMTPMTHYQPTYKDLSHIDRSLERMVL